MNGRTSVPRRTQRTSAASHAAGPSNFAAPFAAILSRDGKATVYGPDNGDIRSVPFVLEAAAVVEVTRSRAMFVRVPRDIVALDGDAPKTCETACRSFVAEVRALGLHPVLEASGNPHRPDSHHVFVRVPDPALRESPIERAKGLGFDVRDSIRPPMSPHRLGGRSQLLDPTDPLDALVALAPTTRPLSPLRGRMRQVAKDGDRAGYPHAVAPVTLALVNLGWPEAAARAFLLNPAHRVGRSLQAIGDPAVQRARIARLYRSAVKKRDRNPTCRSHPEVDAELDGIIASLDAEPACWRGTQGAALYVTEWLCIAVARRSGSRVVHPGVRLMAEALGVNFRTASGYLHGLRRVGLLAPVRPGGGVWPASWRLQSASLPSPEEQSAPDVDTSLPLRGARRRGVHVVPPCVEDWVAPDVFGPHGWFGTQGLGFDAWRALIMIEQADGAPIPMSFLAAHLDETAAAVVARLLDLRLVEATEHGYRRGAATLVDAARALRTLGTRTWKRVLHRAERRRYRANLPQRATPAAVARGAL